MGASQKQSVEKNWSPYVFFISKLKILGFIAPGIKTLTYLR